MSETYAEAMIQVHQAVNQDILDRRLLDAIVSALDERLSFAAGFERAVNVACSYQMPMSIVDWVRVLGRLRVDTLERTQLLLSNDVLQGREAKAIAGMLVSLMPETFPGYRSESAFVLAY